MAATAGDVGARRGRLRKRAGLAELIQSGGEGDAAPLPALLGACRALLRLDFRPRPARQGGASGGTGRQRGGAAPTDGRQQGAARGSLTFDESSDVEEESEEEDDEER